MGESESETVREPVRLKVILLVVGLHVGGTEGQVLEIATRLDRRRFDVTVCALKGDGVIAGELRERGVRVITLGGRGKLDARVIIRLWRLIQMERPDVLHSFLFWANLAARVVGRMLRVPLLISSYRGLDEAMSGLHRAVDRWTAEWAKVVTCSSEAVRRSVLDRIGGDPARYVVISNGVDVDRFNKGSSLKRQDLGLRDGPPALGTVCRLHEPMKGLSVLLQAVALMTRRSLSLCCQLLIVGEGPALKQLREHSAKLGISDRVMFAGMRRDIADLLSLMDVFVLPSLYEGFGIAIVEAMMAGRPVVATKVGGIPEIVVQGETGLLVPPGDPAALAEAIAHLVNYPEKARLMGARGRERACARFSVEGMVRRHEDLYSACVKEPA